MLTEKEIKVLNQLWEDISYENYFFKKVINVKWFMPLKDKGYFSPEKVPQPIPADNKGLFTIPEWNILPYLEQVSGQVNTPGNEGYIDELLNIIKEVTAYHVSGDKCLDNCRKWWYFVKILLNIPANRILFDIVEQTYSCLFSLFV